MPKIDPEMEEIFEGFLIETQELLDNISLDLMEIESNPEDLDLINKIFRSFHTIKGTASFMGFQIITTITHEAEDILNKMRRSELVHSNEITDVLFEVHDWIKLIVEKIKDDDDSPTDYSETFSKLKEINLGQKLINKEDSSEGDTNDFENTKEVFEIEDAFNKVVDSKEIISGEDDFSDEELDLIQAAFKEINAEFSENISSTNTQKDGLEKEFEKETDSVESKEAETISKDAVVTQERKREKAKASQGSKKQTEKQDSSPKKNHSETIRIDVNRVESLMDLSGELVLGRNRLSQISDLIEKGVDVRSHIKDLIETTSQVDFITSEIQTAVMKMRMVQVAKLYQKAPRIVRDLSRASKKKIKLEVKGEDTEIDRGIIEELNDPLVHMIRNSCDHGIEAPEERVKLGKPETGVITLDADQEGNNIILRISDDGKGMNPDILRKKAVEKGVMSHEQASALSKREALKLIFAPGFSTAKVVTGVSGRGVGMDVVRTNIEKLKGTIEIESDMGVGSTFIIKLPLTLAIIQGLLVKVKNESYAIPLSSVEEVVSIEAKDINTINQQKVIRIREEVYPLIFLNKVLGIGNSDEKLIDKNAVIVGLGLDKIGIIVDELLGQQEIVIKSLGEYLGSISGIAGSTILGDGRVIMIVDVPQLITMYYKKNN